jgi:hypothetical protein
MTIAARVARRFLAGKTWYHGTTPANAAKIRAEGFDVDAPRRSDPGDFGWGIYLTDRPSRARSYGREVLAVTIDESRFARLPNPYFLKGLEQVEPRTAAEKLFYSAAFDDEGHMLTVSSPDRVGAAKAVTRAFLAKGYAGIIGGPHTLGDLEVVVFDPSAVSVSEG